jgi:N6-L-threonylcarbamoyladenine synthase
MNNKSSTILAIETSCDETAAAVVSLESGMPVVRSSVVSSQVELHREYGGVVPNLAAREHVRNLVPVVDEAMREAGVTPDDIDAIAVTQGPGLIPALLAGVAAAKTLALIWRKPLLGIHHIEGHIYANYIRVESQVESKKRKVEFPILALVVSGGHTELVLMRDHFEYEILGRTKDDAAGEAFDKVAKMLGLPYPGGPIVAECADKHQTSSSNHQTEHTFPRPMIDSGDYASSFSGLKTAVLYEIRKTPEAERDEDFVNGICHAFQEAVIDVLTTKTRRAIHEFAPRTLVIAGGVSANVALRESLTNMIAAEFPDTEFRVPEFRYSLDNAAMIGSSAALRFARLSLEEREVAKHAAVTLEPDANLPLGA